MSIKPSFNMRDKVFQHAISLIDDETNSTYNMLIDNGINTMPDLLIMSFKHIEDIEDRVDKRCIKLSLYSTNRLKVLKSFHLYSAHEVLPLNMNDSMSLKKEEFGEFCLTY